jgi:hypothetical protein
VLGKQDPGDFGIKNNMKGKFGPLVTRVYRSYGYMQHLDDIEEFKTPEGISYWYNARTGETVWEKPLALEDGYLDSDDDEEDDGMDPLSREESKQVTYSENKMRKHLLADYEADATLAQDSVGEAKQANKMSLGSLKNLPGPSIAKNPMSNQGQLPPVPLAFQNPTPRSEGGMTSRSRMGDAALIRQTDASGNVSGHASIPNPTPRMSGTPRLTCQIPMAATVGVLQLPRASLFPLSKRLQIHLLAPAATTATTAAATPPPPPTTTTNQLLHSPIKTLPWPLDLFQHMYPHKTQQHNNKICSIFLQMHFKMLCQHFKTNLELATTKTAKKCYGLVWVWV